MHIALVHSSTDTPDNPAAETNPNGPHIMHQTIRSFKEAFKANDHHVTTIEADNDLLRTLGEMEPVDLVVNISTGITDKRSQANIVGMLELTNLPMLGSGLLSHVIGLHKEVTKSLLIAHGIRTAKYQLVAHEDDDIRPDFQYPLIVKPEHEGSGIGIDEASIVETPHQLRETIIEKLADHQQVLLIEEFLPGREFTVGIIGNTTLEVLPIKETVFPEDGAQVLTNEMKLDATSLSEIPADISKTLADEIREMAEKTYRTLRCQDFARIDFRLDRDGKPNVIELNTFPGMEKGYSFFPLIAEAAGYSYEALVNRLVEVALEPKGWQSSRGN